MMGVSRQVSVSAGRKVMAIAVVQVCSWRPVEVGRRGSIHISRTWLMNLFPLLPGALGRLRREAVCFFGRQFSSIWCGPLVWAEHRAGLWGIGDE